MGEGGPFSTIVVFNLSLKKNGQVAGSVPIINVSSLDSDEIKWFEESFNVVNVLVKAMSVSIGFSSTWSEVRITESITIYVDVF
jgi:hypothetical protein